MVVKIILGALVVTVIGLVVFKAIDPTLDNPSSNEDSIIDSGIDEESKISIGISGEVVREGNYVLDEGATMAQLIEAAGGVTTNADERCYFFEAILTENESYYIPPKFEVDDVCGNNPIEKININTASTAELMDISGVGATISQKIVDYRDENGTFYALEELKNVSGIGNATFSKMRNEIILKD